VSDGYVYVADSWAGMAILRDCPLFSDGFESGSPSVWSLVVGGTR
jgi:hypothetical protein